MNFIQIQNTLTNLDHITDIIKKAEKPQIVFYYSLIEEGSQQTWTLEYKSTAERDAAFKEIKLKCGL